MNILVIDGQGGALGARVVKQILSEFDNIELTVIGSGRQKLEKLSSSLIIILLIHTLQKK